MEHQKSKDSILIITQVQFGYHTDTFEYSRYLREKFNIEFLCWDYGLFRSKLKGVNVLYLARKGNLLLRNIDFVYQSIKRIRSFNGTIFVKYFSGCSLLRFFFRKKIIIVDIRTGSVANTSFKRYIYNILMKFEFSAFKYGTIISDSLASSLGITKYHILPLGANVISESTKKFNSLNLLYIGTLSNRRIEDTIIGFALFYKKYKMDIPITYTIVGSGYNNEENLLNKIIEKEGLSDIVQMVGRVPYDKISQYLDVSNIGVSYIPKTDYYDCQPPTKTFEYLFSGIPVIGTSTTENKFIINSSNGVLVDDNPNDFYRGLCELFENRNNFNSNVIREGISSCSWERIVNSNLLKYLNDILYSGK